MHNTISDSKIEVDSMSWRKRRQIILVTSIILLFIINAISSTFAQDIPPDEPQIMFISDRNGAREIWDIYIVNADGNEIGRIDPEEYAAEEGGVIYSADLSPDGRFLAFSSYLERTDLVGSTSGEIFVRDLRSGELTDITDATVKDHRENNDYVLWSPDGSRFAYFTGGWAGSQGYFDIRIVDAETLETRMINPYGAIRSASWSPDGSYMVLESFLTFETGIQNNPLAYETVLFIVNMDNGDTQRITPYGLMTADAVWGSGGMVYFKCDNGFLCQIDLATLEIETFVDWREWFGEKIPVMYDFSISSDGRIIFVLSNYYGNAAGGSYNEIYLFDTNDKTLTRLIFSDEDNLYSNRSPRWIYDELLEKDWALLPVVWCNEELPSHFVPGDSAYIIDLGTGGNILRAEPGLEGERIGVIPVNTEFTIIDGPSCRDNLGWYQVQMDDGATGWTVEGETPDYYIGRVETNTFE
jgi:Tol biopolymer transport system component